MIPLESIESLCRGKEANLSTKKAKTENFYPILRVLQLISIALYPFLPAKGW